jgi:hypothetical protein
MTETTGVFWKQESENEYSVQVSFPPGKAGQISDMFSGWLNIGEGVDTTKNEEIMIFRKVFPAADDFNSFIIDLNNNNVIVKEAT